MIGVYRLILDEQTRHTGIEKVQELEGECRSLDSTEAIFKFMIDTFEIGKMADEYVYMLAFNSKFKLLGVFEISHGTSRESILDPREVYTRALLIGADCIVIVHNHPSGDVTPSKFDEVVTSKVKQAGDIVGIKLIDHIIIANNQYVSIVNAERKDMNDYIIR